MGMPPQLIIMGMPDAIIDIMRSQHSFIMSMDMPFIGFMVQVMPAGVISQVISHIMVGIIIGIIMPIWGTMFICGTMFIMGFIIPIIGFIMGIGIMPPDIIGFIMLFICGIAIAFIIVSILILEGANQVAVGQVLPTRSARSNSNGSRRNTFIQYGGWCRLLADRHGQVSGYLSVITEIGALSQVPPKPRNC